MAGKPSRSKYSILDEVDRITHKESSDKGACAPIRKGFPTVYSRPRHLEVVKPSTIDNWLRILSVARSIPPTALIDEFTNMKLVLGTLRREVNTLKQESSISKKTMAELSKKVQEIRSVILPTIPNLDELTNAYIQIVSSINIVHKVLVVETTEAATIWTIIDAPPFEDSYRDLVYDAQIEIFNMTKEDIPLDFYILNVSELVNKQELDKIIPSNSKLVWER